MPSIIEQILTEDRIYIRFADGSEINLLADHILPEKSSANAKKAVIEKSQQKNIEDKNLIIEMENGKFTNLTILNNPDAEAQ